MSARRGFLTGGTWCLDRNRFIERWPQEDRLAKAWGLEEDAGGSAANLSLGMKRLDPSMPVATLALAGTDAAGRQMRALAESAGIDTRGFRLIDGTSHVTDCFVSRESGQRTHITDIGVGNILSPEHFDFSSHEERIFHLGLPGVHETMDADDGAGGNGWRTVLQMAKAAGFETSLELVTLPPEEQRRIILPCLAHLDYLVINDNEVAALADMETAINGAPDAALCLEAARLVMARGSMALMAVHSPRGAICLTSEGAIAAAPSLAIDPAAIAGPNGAGDAFCAGFLYGVHEGLALNDSLHLGHASAAASLRSASTTAGITSWRECLVLARQWPVRDEGWAL